MTSEFEMETSTDAEMEMEFDNPVNTDIEADMIEPDMDGARSKQE